MEVTRRDLFIGGSMLAAAASAAALTPRERLVLLGDKKIDAIVPTRIGNWTHVPSTAFVLPKTPGSLADRLYSQTVSRLYQSPSQVPVMLVIAYGNLQSDLLQLHRPEACYTSVGVTISRSAVANVALGPKAALRVRELVASSDSRIEPIVYWTRIGDDLPTDGSEQRWSKLRQQMNGLIPDGVLVRVSTVGEPTAEVFAGLREFCAEMVRAVASGNRAALVGRPLAGAMA